MVFFGAIGLGFMFVEIALIQRLSAFLGQPAYSIGVALFGLLLSSGTGSYLTGRLPRSATIIGPALIWGLAALLVGEALALSAIIELAQAHSLPIRLGVSLILVMPLGLLMGTAFPLGATVAVGRAPHILPWLWGINGTASVVASVVAALVSLEAGIVENMWIGAACYVLAGVSLVIAANGWSTRFRWPIDRALLREN